jgi:hypothetical protein
MAIGFAKTSNLFESQDSNSATKIFNNLAGEGISSDIALFTNNLGTVTELDFTNFKASLQSFSSSDEVFYTTGDATSYEFIVIPASDFGKVPLSNGAIVYVVQNPPVSTKTYYIADDSNGIDRFKLYEWDGTTKGAVASWDDFKDLQTKTFFRSDPVTFANMTNYSKDRTTMNDESTTLENPYSLEEGEGQQSRDRSQQITFLQTLSPTSMVSSTDSAIDSFLYKESKNILSHKKTVLNKLLTVNAPVQITNDDGLVLGSTATNDTMPGLYIMADGVKARAFSDTTNPWVVGTEDLTSYDTADTVLATESFIKTASSTQDAMVLNLIYKGPNPHLITTNTSGVRTTNGAKVVNSTWTHKAKVEINGEAYYLLLTDQASTFS